MARSAASPSAKLVALARTHLMWMGIIDDPYAAQMLPTAWVWRGSASVLRLPGLGILGRNPSFGYLAGRTRSYDDFVADALDRGIQQVVVLAAGYDSRAWRFSRPGVTFYEVDLPPTQADKRSRAPAGGPVYVPADVTASSLPDVLVAAGLKPGQPTAFTAEGLTMYLTEEQVARLLRTLADLGGPGSRLAVNFGVGFERQESHRGRFGRRYLAARGEAFRFRLELSQARSFLAQAGWSVEQTMTGPMLRDRYLVGTELAGVTITTAGFVVEAAAVAG